MPFQQNPVPYNDFLQCIYSHDGLSDAFLTEFKDDSELNEDSWIVGPNSELLFWVPPLHRSVLWRPSNIAVIGQHSTKIDFSRFVHGTSWARCASWV
jgi:hypothetical protein